MKLLDRILIHLSGASIGYYLYKLLKLPEHYKCKKCNNIFEGKPTNCPYCNIRFRWS